jgi:hypothetical protein
LVEIRIFASTDGGASYPIELTVAGWRSFPTGVLRLDLAGLTSLGADPRGYGQALGEMLFAPAAIGDAFRESVAALKARDEEMRLRLRLDPPELYSLGWERVLAPLDGGWQPWAARGDTPFSRNVLAPRWERPQLVTTRPLQLLAVIASPTGLEHFGLDAIPAAERQGLHTLLDGLPDLAVTYLESGSTAPPTLNAIRRALADGYHLLHFLCHGAAAATGTALYLEDEAGAVEVVRAERLVDAVAVLKTPPLLCFLAACESAARARQDAFVPLGPALVEQGGVLAVVAMAERVGIDTARLFTGQFYAELFQHGLVDLAVNVGRAQVQDQWDWGAPVLFCRLHDSQLVDFPVGQPIAELGSVATTVERALTAARRQEHGAQLVAELERLLAAFEASFRNLVRLGSDFRAVGSDPGAFGEKFQAFYLSFKDYYDQETFADEQALLRQMLNLKAETLPKLQPLLDPATFQQLQSELDQMATNRAGLIQGFGDYLEPMNTAVDEIKALLDGGDAPGAIARKLAFETQISPSLRRSKQLLGVISAGIGSVQAA